MPNFTPRLGPPLVMYIIYIYVYRIYVTSRLYTRTCIYIHIYISLARGVRGKCMEIEKGRKLYTRGKRNTRRTKYLRSYTHTYTHTFMYGIAATHIWIIWLNDEFRVLWVLFIVKGPGWTRSLEICVRGGREWGGLASTKNIAKTILIRSTCRHKLCSNN